MSLFRLLRLYTLHAQVTPAFRRHAGASLAILMLTVSWSTTAIARTSDVGDEIVRSAAPTLDDVVSAFTNRTWTISAPAATVTVDAKLQRVVDDLLGRSVTFRRQWCRLIRNPRLVIQVTLVHSSPVAGSHAATELIALPNGSLMANVAIPGGSRLAEVLGHELEHVLEGLDGARVSALHALGDKSVRRASGTFETERAILVGRLVSGEYYRSQ